MQKQKQYKEARLHDSSKYYESHKNGPKEKDLEER